MPAIHSVMKRFGFVKLRDYGLVLTPEGRILSIRPAVLDDGLGGRIVGWKDDDLAAMELERWSELGRAMAAKPASRPAVATPVAVRPIAPLARAAAPARPAAAPTAPDPVVVAPAVASEPVVDEDDWEWTIAIARARAAAEEAEQAAAAALRPSQRRMRADTVPPPTGTRPQQSTPSRPLPAAAMAMARSAAEATAKASAVAAKPLAPTALAKPVATRDTQPLDDFDVSDDTSATIVRAPAKDTVPSIAAKPAFVNATTVVETPTPSIAPPIAPSIAPRIATPVAQPIATRVAQPIATPVTRPIAQPVVKAPTAKVPVAAIPPVEKTTPLAKVADAPRALIPPPLQVPTPPQASPVVTIPVVAPNRTFARGQSPATVIPIPKIPRVPAGKLAPVVPVRSSARPSVRFAKGTGPVVPSTDDKTHPGLLLPQASRSVSR